MKDNYKIVEAGKAVYFGYLLLEILNDEKNNYFITNDTHGLSVTEYIANLVKENNFSDSIEQALTVGKKKFNIRLFRDSALESPPYTYQVEVVAVDENSNDLAYVKAEIPFKSKNQYHENDFYHLANQHELAFHFRDDERYAFSTKVRDHIIGGLDKINLYPIHPSNLYQIISHIEKGKNVNILIAMATGSGKSFTQALFAPVLDIAGYRGVFIVHQSALAEQLQKDFGKLLPSSVTTSIVGCDDIIQDTKGHIITTHDIFFKEKAAEFKQLLESNRCWVNIDEAHNATRVELYKKAIGSLQAPIIYLTATPSEFIAQHVGCVINLSPQEKEKQGICKSDIKTQSAASSRIQKTKKRRKFHLGERIALRFADLIETEKLSIAHELTDKIEESVFYRKRTDSFYVTSSDHEASSLRKSLRWNVHLPVGEKLLLLVGRGSHDAVVNCHLKFHGNGERTYEGGNSISRTNVYGFFQLYELYDYRQYGQLDEYYLRQYEASKKALRKAGLCHYLRDHHALAQDSAQGFVDACVDYARSIAERQELNVLHGIIENTLSYLTGYDSITLNHKRRHDLESLIKVVQEKLTHNSSEYRSKRLGMLVQKEGIPENIAAQIVEQEMIIIGALQRVNGAETNALFEAIVDNWSLDKNLHDHYFQNSGLFSGLSAFCIRHKTIFMVNGLQRTATEIEENRPFFKLKEYSFELHKDGNEELKRRTRHKLSTIEALDDTTDQHYYNPEYCDSDYTATVVQKLTKMGLIGACISSEMTTGYNDPNLCTVGVLVNETDENINNPDEIIQSNRNRGLDASKQPAYFIVNNEGVSVSFDVNILKTGDYIRELNRAQKRHNKAWVKSLGFKIAQQIKDLISDDIDPLGEINVDRLESELIAIIWEEYEALYNQNHHDKKKTQEDFTRILTSTYGILYSAEEDITQERVLPMSAKVITFLLELITKVIYWFTSRAFSERFKQEAKVLASAKDSALSNEKTYAYIVRNYPYKGVVTHILALRKLAQAVEHKMQSSHAVIKDSPYKFINTEKMEALNARIKDVLIAGIHITDLNAAQKQHISTLIEQGNNWASEGVLLYLKQTMGQALDGNDMDYNRLISNALLGCVSQNPVIKEYLATEKIDQFNIENLADIFELLQKLRTLQQEMPKDMASLVDQTQCEKYIIDSIAHYFQSEIIKKVLNYFIRPLQGEHLFTILKAMYPDADECDGKKEKIERLMNMINQSQPLSEIAQAFGGLMELQKVISCLISICAEILHCHGYYHRVNEKGDPVYPFDEVPPKLYEATTHQLHGIWSQRSSSKDGEAAMHNKVQFISGSFSSLKEVSEIDYLDMRHNIEYMKIAAEKLTLFLRSLNGKKSGATSAIEDVAQQLRHLSPLEGDTYRNAVQQARTSKISCR